MNFFEIMKYFARAIEQMRAVDGILIPQFPWPYIISHISHYSLDINGTSIGLH